MSTHNVGKSERETQAPRADARRRFLAGMLTGGLLGSLLAGSINVYSHAKHGPWGHHHHGAFNPEMAAARVEFATDWVLSRIKASEEQRQQVQAIVQAAVHDLLQVREQHQAHRQAWLEALAQPTVDRAALGQLRQAEVQLMELASSRMVDAMADVAEVLTPEQRTALLEFVTRLHH